MKNWFEQIDSNTQLFKETFGHLNYKEFNKKPNPQTWSIAQNIEHLVLINSSYFAVFDELKNGSLKLPFYGNVSFISTFFGKLILNAVEPERDKKTKTFGVWKPSKSDIPLDILETFAKSQEDLKQYISTLSNEIKLNTVIYSPASKNIILPLPMAIEIIITHEKRHFNQSIEIINTLYDH